MQTTTKRGPDTKMQNLRGRTEPTMESPLDQSKLIDRVKHRDYRRNHYHDHYRIYDSQMKESNSSCSSSRSSGSCSYRSRNYSSNLDLNLNFNSILVIFFIQIPILILIVLSNQQVHYSVSCHQSTGDYLPGSKMLNPSVANTNRAREALELIRDWSQRIGLDIYRGTEEATCIRSIRDNYSPDHVGPYKASVESIDWTSTHSRIVSTISDTMSWHRDAVEKIARQAEWFSGNHTFNKNLTVDYVDVHKLKNLDDLKTDQLGNPIVNESDQSITTHETSHEMSNGEPTSDDSASSPSSQPLDTSSDSSLPRADSTISNSNLEGSLAIDETTGLDQTGSGREDEQLPKALELVMQNPEQSQQQQQQQKLQTPAGVGQELQDKTGTKYLKLSRHPNFGDVLINTDESAVHVPVHIYPGEPYTMNDIAWSEQLTQVFKDNFMINPKLTNQFFASQRGFLRLFPAQPWQMKREDPDLYDARMRPWYVAGASSRKDVIILVDSSGSMTGSRRDIARGVALEILDTLTDNDNFLILKFSDSVQQVGIPSCPRMRSNNNNNQTAATTTTTSGQGKSRIPEKNKISRDVMRSLADGGRSLLGENDTDIESFFLLPANGRNVRHVRSNFTITTSGIANFSRALVTAFEVFRNYHDNEILGTPCNQAIMLITDGSPSNFKEIFDTYNYHNAPIRVFTYLIGRDAGDISNTKMMACENRGYYTHVINLAEVRETVQQYIPVMARPLVLNGTHPITWTPAYGELTYQTLTDWIWESGRRDRLRNELSRCASLQQQQQSQQQQTQTSTIITSNSNNADHSPILTYNENGLEMIQSGSELESASFMDDEKLKAVDLFGYSSDPACYWETHQNDLLTTIVEPVYDLKNESIITERFLLKSTWQINEYLARTARLLGVAAADMKINDIIALAPSHKLGPNAYAIMLSNNGFAMHHPDMRSVLEPRRDADFREMRILKPHFSSLDLSQVEHALNDRALELLMNLRREAVSGLTGWRELATKRALDCQRRPQIRVQTFYYQPLKLYPFSFIVAIPQPYGSHRIKAQVELKSANLPKELTAYFTTNQYDVFTIHPNYEYCEGPSNNSITNLLDMLGRIQSGRSNDVEWIPQESKQPRIYKPDKIVCDKDLVQSLVFDAVATYNFSENCSIPSSDVESDLIRIYGVRFAFVATRSGLTRVRLFDDQDVNIKKELVAFTRFHARSVDETFYSRTVDYNMLHNQSAVVIRVPFNGATKIRETLIAYETEVRGSLTSEFPLESSYNSNETQESILPSNGLIIGNENFKRCLLTGSSTNTCIEELSLCEKLQVLNQSSIHLLASQSIVVSEGSQKAVAGVTGVFYDYASFVMRLYRSTNQRFQRSDGYRPGNSDDPSNTFCPEISQHKETTSKHEQSSNTEVNQIRCGFLDDPFDCLLLDNNGFIVVSEQLDMIGRHVKQYDENILASLINSNVYREVNITDYQAICDKIEDKQNKSASSSISSFKLAGLKLASLWAKNLLGALATLYTLAGDVAGYVTNCDTIKNQEQTTRRVYPRPCEKRLILYESITPDSGQPRSSRIPIEHFNSNCPGCSGWLVYEPVPFTNLIMLVVQQGTDQEPCKRCSSSSSSQGDLDQDNPIWIEPNEEQLCDDFEREFRRHKKRPDSCYSYHPEEVKIKLCGGAGQLVPYMMWLYIVATSFVTITVFLSNHFRYRVW